MNQDTEIRIATGTQRSPAGTVLRESTISFPEAAGLSPWKRGSCLLLFLCGAACSSPPEIRPADARRGHDFVLLEEYRGQIRKIAVWLEPGRELRWELIRSTDPERNQLPFMDLDYGRTPDCMDQTFPRGVPEPIENGQILRIALEYAPEGEADPIVRNTVTRWYQKKARPFSELSESEAEAEAEEKARKEHKEGKP